MRRGFVLLAAAVMVTATLIGPAAAGAATNRPASFCSTAKGIGKDLSNLDASDYTSAKVLDKVVRALKTLQKQSPDKLKPAFKSIVGFYTKVTNGGIDASDPKSIGAFSRQATKAAKAFGKVEKYLRSTCKLKLS
jgi:hypothetical protein